MTQPIYFDYNATTPLDPRVLEKMLPFFFERFGNAASRHHSYGCDAAMAVEKAREQVAAVLGADPREIVWTSGATESNNLALKGVMTSPYYSSRGDHLITVASEHKAVLDPCEHQEASGKKLTVLPVDGDGFVDLDRLAAAISNRTVLVSVMHGNNEIGVLQPTRKIGELCRERGVVFHTDATQSFGKEPLNVGDDKIDLLSVSAHKFYGPKGVGALYVRRRSPRIRCEAVLHGGGHERGMRSGTLNVPGIVGMGEAAEICRREREEEQGRIGRLRDRFEKAILEQIPGVLVNGTTKRRLAGTTNLSFPGIEGEDLMKRMPELAVSSSSACTSAMQEPSHVLGALGVSDQRAQGSVRFSLGRFTTTDEVDRAVAMIVKAI